MLSSGMHLFLDPWFSALVAFVREVILLRACSFQILVIWYHMDLLGTKFGVWIVIHVSQPQNPASLLLT